MRKGSHRMWELHRAPVQTLAVREAREPAAIVTGLGTFSTYKVILCCPSSQRQLFLGCLLCICLVRSGLCWAGDSSKVMIIRDRGFPVRCLVSRAPGKISPPHIHMIIRHRDHHERSWLSTTTSELHWSVHVHTTLFPNFLGS